MPMARGMMAPPAPAAAMADGAAMEMAGAAPAMAADKMAEGEMPGAGGGGARQQGA